MQVEAPKTPKWKNKWITIIVIFIIIFLAFLNIVAAREKSVINKEELKFAKAVERTLTNTKLISGQVVPGRIETIYVDPSKGDINEIYIKEGDKVEKGKKLFLYENADLSLQIEQAKIDKKMVDMEYEEGRKKINSLKREIQKAKDEKVEQMVLDSPESQLAEAEMQQKRMDLEIEKNKLHMQELQNKQAKLIVYSNTTGIVQKLDNDALQSSVQAMGQSKPFIQIASEDPFQIQGTLTELQKAQIQKDQPIIVTSKAVSGKTWKGKISEVSDYPTTVETGGILSEGQQGKMISNYNYSAGLESQDGLIPGYHVTLQVELSSKKVLSIPMSSLVEEEDSTYLYVMENNKLYKKMVSTGLSDGEWIEILEGLSKGEMVVENPSANLYDGMEVKTGD